MQVTHQHEHNKNTQRQTCRYVHFNKTKMCRIGGGTVTNNKKSGWKIALTPILKVSTNETTVQQKSVVPRAEPQERTHTTVKMSTRSANCFVNKKINMNTKRAKKNAV